MNNYYQPLHDEQKKEALEKFAQGDHFSLFNAVLNSLWEPSILLRNKEFVLQMLSGNCNKPFFEVYKTQLHELSKDYSPDSPALREQISTFWNGHLHWPMPFVFCIIPFLEDTQLCELLHEHYANYYNHAQQEAFIEQMLLHCFKNGFEQTLKAHHQSNFFYPSQASLDKSFMAPELNSEPKKLKEILQAYAFNNYKLLPYYCEATWSNVDSTVVKWVEAKISEKDFPTLKQFITTELNSLEEPLKSQVVALTLKNTSDTKLLKHALSTLGLKSLAHYHTPHYPVWHYINEHVGEKTLDKLLKAGNDLFDYDSKDCSFLLSKIVTYHYTKPDASYNGENMIEILKEVKVPPGKVFKGILSPLVDSEGLLSNKFAALITTHMSPINDLLNINLHHSPLHWFDEKFTSLAYHQLHYSEQFKFIEELLNKTWLQDVFIHERHSYYQQKTKEAQIVLNLFLDSTYYGDRDVWLVQEHFKLMKDHDLQISDELAQQYGKAISYFFKSSHCQYIRQDSSTYAMMQDIIDVCICLDSMPWSEWDNSIKEHSATGASRELINMVEYALLQRKMASDGTTQKKRPKL